MAEVVSAFPKTAVGSKYPWSEWMNGQVWKLTKGIDFNCTVESFTTGCHYAAKVSGKRAKTRRDGDTVYVCATPNK